MIDYAALDVLAVERVLGWTRCELKPGAVAAFGWRTPDGRTEVLTPSLSRDIAAAWRLVRATPGDWCITRYSVETLVSVESVDHDYKVDDLDSVTTGPNEEALAITIAACKARGVTDEELKAVGVEV